MTIISFLLLLIMAACMGASDGGRGLLVRRMKVETAMAVLYLFAIPAGLIVLWFYGIPEIRAGAWTALLISTSLHLPVAFLFYYGLKKTDLTVMGGIMALAPVSVLFGEWFINKDTPNGLGLGGVVVATIGAYVLKADKFKDGPLQPFKVLFSDPGARLGLIMLAIFSVTVPCQRRAVQLSNPAFALLFEMGCVAFVVTILALAKNRDWQKEIRENYRLLTKTGIVWAIGVVCMYAAFQNTLGSFVHTMRALSVFFLLLIAAKSLKENWRKPLPGLIVISVGVTMIALA
ncbi:MAG: EamA family transporter [Candidatus Uhrbacteria bacterium]